MTGHRFDGTAGTAAASTVSMEALLGLLRRRLGWVLVPAVLVTTVFALAAILLPPRYRAEALVAAESTTPEGYPEPGVEQQLAAISAVLFRRSVLEDVIAKHDLSAGETGKVSDGAVDALRSRISVRMEGERTFSLGYEDQDRERVTAVASDLAAHLVGTSHGERQERASADVLFLETQLATVKAQVDQQERAIEAYQTENIDEVPDQVATSLKLLESIQARQQSIATSVTDDEARRASMLRELRDLERQGVTATPPKKASELRVEELRVALQQLERRYTQVHPDVVRARTELEVLEKATAAGAAGSGVADYSPLQMRYLQLRADRDAAEERIARSRAEQGELLSRSRVYQRRIEAAPRHQLALTSMKRDLETARLQHQSLLDKLQPAQLAERHGKTAQGAIFRIVEEARLPSAPVAPRRLRILLMGLAVGLGLGIGAALLVDRTDATFRDVEELEAGTDLRVLAAIPGIGSLAGGASTSIRAAVLEDPSGFAAERYRILAAKILRQQGDRPVALLITSALGGEGKTTTAVNLSLALSRMVPGEVLLVDADLSRSSVHDVLGFPQGDGLRQLLASHASDPMPYLRRHHGIAVLEAGIASRLVRADLASPFAQRVFQQLRQHFACVVVDAPPVLAVAEGLILQQMVDSCLLVVRARRTPRAMVRRAMDALERTRLVGFVLNDAREDAAVYGYPYAVARGLEPSSANAGVA